MNEMQDKELDDLFRKSLTDSDIPFDPDAWKAMESKLDAEDRRRTVYFRISAGIIAGIFLLAGSIYFMQQKDAQSLAQDRNSNAATVEHLSFAASDKHTDTPAGSSDFSIVIESTTTTTTNNNNNNNNNNSHKDDTSNRSNTGAVFQKADVSVAQEPQAAASHHIGTTAVTAQTARTKSMHKNTTAGTDTEQNKKYTSEEKYLIPGNTNNNTSAYTGVQKAGYKNAAMDTISVQQAGSSDQAHVAGNNMNRSENNSPTEKNNSAEANSVTGLSTAAITGMKKSTPSSGSRNMDADADVATTTTTTNNNNNTAEADTKNVQTSVLHDAAQQQQIHSKLNSSNEENAIAEESAARKASDTLVVVWADSIPAKAEPLAHTDTSTVKEKINNDPYKRGFSISLVLNPEYNSPVDFSFYKPNLNVGLYVEYYILPRISIVSGIMYGQKLYTCDASDYASSPSYVRYGRTYYPDYVEASCGVLDIPVNVRYKFLNKKTFNVYAATGLSSYIMLKETYVFQYSKYNRPDDQYQIHNKNRYLFNIWNISLGIEKRINDKWSLQAEPYVKLPLNGVGAGDIKLVSTGVYFSLKYYFK